MEDYRRGSHTVYDIKYHIVWVTKYRYKVLTGDVGLRVRELVRQVCMAQEVTILKGHVSSDHVHIFVSVPPSLSASKLVQYIKGNSSHRLQMEFATLRKRYWGQHIWARGYFCASSGNITDEMIKAYIEHQCTEPEGGDFRVEGEPPPSSAGIMPGRTRLKPKR